MPAPKKRQVELGVTCRRVSKRAVWDLHRMLQDLISARVLQTATTLVEQEFDIAQPCTFTLVISWSLTRHATSTRRRRKARPSGIIIQTSQICVEAAYAKPAQFCSTATLKSQCIKLPRYKSTAEMSQNESQRNILSLTSGSGPFVSTSSGSKSLLLQVHQILHALLFLTSTPALYSLPDVLHLLMCPCVMHRILRRRSSCRQRT